MPLSSLDAVKRSLRVTRAKFLQNVGDTKELLRRRSKIVRKSRNQLRKAEERVKELGGEVSEDVSDYSSMLCETSSGSDSNSGTEGEPASEAPPKEVAAPEGSSTGGPAAKVARHCCSCSCCFEKTSQQSTKSGSRPKRLEMLELLELCKKDRLK